MTLKFDLDCRVVATDGARPNRRRLSRATIPLESTAATRCRYDSGATLARENAIQHFHARQPDHFESFCLVFGRPRSYSVILLHSVLLSVALRAPLVISVHPVMLFNHVVLGLLLFLLPGKLSRVMSLSRQLCLVARPIIAQSGTC